MADPEVQEYDSEISAYKDVLDDFLEGVSLYRMKFELYDQRLEVYPDLNDKGVVVRYDYIGKIKFIEHLEIDEDGEETIKASPWRIFFEYSLTLDNGDEEKEGENKSGDKASKANKKERWVLEKIADEDYEK